MQRWLSKKPLIVLIAALGLASLLVVSIGLPELAFRPGRPVGRAESATVQLAVRETMDRLEDVLWWEQLILWGILFLLVLLAGMLMTPEGRRRLMRSFLRLAAFFWAVQYIMEHNGDLLTQLTLGLEASGVSAAAGDGGPPPVFEAPQISPGLIAVVSLALAVGLTLAFTAARRWWDRTQAFRRMRPQNESLAEIARASLTDLSTGRALEDVILECYARMSRTVEMRRGLSRQESMTPGEFAARLERAGLPGEAVQGLTGLFERVRYGGHPTTPAEKSRAVECLNSILRSCGEAV
jgi:hypothetical protein